MKESLLNGPRRLTHHMSLRDGYDSMPLLTMVITGTSRSTVDRLENIIRLAIGG